MMIVIIMLIKIIVSNNSNNNSGKRNGGGEMRGEKNKLDEAKRVNRHAHTLIHTHKCARDRSHTKLGPCYGNSRIPEDPRPDWLPFRWCHAIDNRTGRWCARGQAGWATPRTLCIYARARSFFFMSGGQRRSVTRSDHFQDGEARVTSTVVGRSPLQSSYVANKRDFFTLHSCRR